MTIWLIVAYAFIFAILRKSSRGKNVLEPLIISFLFLNIIIYISTELFSIPHALNAVNIKLTWIMAALLSGMTWLLLPPRKQKIELDSRWSLPPNVSVGEILLALGVLCICLILLIKTVFSAPFSNDALIYHLPRVMHWIQDKTVVPYPTHILRQLFNPPLSAYFQLHLYLLSGGDHLANFPQYISMLLGLCGVSLICALLGLNRAENLLAVFLAAYLPSGILIAPTGLNDYSVSLWVIGLVIYVLKYIEKNEIKNLIFAVTFLSLICLTKIHPLLIAAPFIAVLLLKTFSKKRSLILIIPVLLVLLIILCLIWTKINSAMNIIASNYVFSPFVQISFVHPKWGLFENIFRHLVTQSSFSKSDEDDPTNPLHTILMIFFLIYFLINKNKLSPLIQKYTTLLLSGTFLSFIVLKASIWTGRFHLPGYVLFCPLIALLIFRSRTLLLPSTLLMFICGTYIALFFSPKPLLGQTGIMQTPRRMQILTYDQYSSMFLEAAQDTTHSGCGQIGLIYKNNIYQREYIIWQTLIEGNPKFRLEHVNVDNASGSLDYPLGTFTPCAVIQATNERFTDTIQVKNNTLKLYKQYNRFVGLYLLDKKGF